MQKIAICVTLYEAGRPYLDAFLGGIRAAARGHDVTLVAAVDGLRDSTIALAGLEPDIRVLRVASPGGLSPAAMRRVMLTTGYTSGADTLVFIDMDDVLSPDALALHGAALREADISYGDLAIIDRTGAPTGRHFFDGADIPPSLERADALRMRNFLGFSNTAVRAGTMPADALAIPEDIVAADWWFFTALLMGGCRAARTAAPVASYRTDADNLLGAGAPADPGQVALQAEAMLRHYRGFPTVAAYEALAAATARRIAALRRMPPGLVAEQLQALRSQPGVWFEHVGMILGSAEPSHDILCAAV